MRIRQQGFTLLEMMIGITLMALIMTTVLMGLRIANRAMQQGEERLGQIYSDEERSDFMGKQIESLVPYRVRSTDPKLTGQFPIIEAKRSCFRFLTTYGSRYRSRSGLVLVEYGVVRESRGLSSLYLRETPVTNDEDLLHQVVQRIATDSDTGKNTLVYFPFVKRATDLELFREMNAARFEYLVPTSDQRAEHWVSDWEPESQVAFPLAVRFVWEQEGHQQQVVLPVRAHSFSK
jgi:prepilin-type N-terminal cleavage/methylation domain-containing protein